jgi:CarboxypepD_reg-like domain/TonB-dependent Receptor Plug Domain
MSIRNSALTSLFLLLSFTIFAQTTFRFSGKVIDADTKQPLPGAAVSIGSIKKAILTDVNGDFALRIPKGEFPMDITFVTYRPYRQKISISENTSVVIELQNLEKELDEVTVTGASNAGVKNMSIGLNTLSIKGIKKMPAIMGEIDILRSLQTLPGVSSMGEGANGVNVRGGNVDQNLIYIDETPIFNPTHMFGLFSVFPADAIRGIELYKGGIPARFGGRTASVMNVNMADPNLESFKMNGGVGPISNRFTAEIPIIKGKLGLITSARVSYNDFWLKLFGNPSISGTKANFIDFANKLYFKPNKKTVISISNYNSNDNYGVDSLFSIQNIIARKTNFRYGHRNLIAKASYFFSPKLSVSLAGIYSDYLTSTFSKDTVNQFALETGVKYRSAKLIFDYTPSSKNKINFGLTGIRYQINPGELNKEIQSNISPVLIPLETSFETAAFVSDEYEINKNWGVEVGLRYVQFFNMSTGNITEYLDTEPKSISSIKSVTQITKGKAESTYGGLEPRVSIKYMFGEEDAIKFGYNRSQQFIQLISNNTTPLPTARWKTSDRHIPAQKSDFLTLGYFKTLKKNVFETSAEIYVRQTQNILDYISGANLQLNPNLETQLLVGNSKAYGLELMLTKKKGETTGWIAYTYARALQQIKGDFPAIQQLNDGKWFSTDYDKPHTVNAVINTQVAKRHTFSWNFAYSTGRPFNAPVGIYQVGDRKYPIYTERNNDRISDYHRLDFSWTINNPAMTERRYEGSWNFTVYNLYGRKNAYSYFFKTAPYGLVLNKLSVFASPFLSLSYNFKLK